MQDRKIHWETIYKNKLANELSWTQEVPKTSLEFIHSFNLSKTASIIDVGAGESKLVDILLDEGYEDITALDISEQALIIVKQRLGEKGNKVKWIVSDITEFKPVRTYDIWHDRAAFHFFTSSSQIKTYIDTVQRAVKEYMVISTFSKSGPAKCSGLEITQYSGEDLELLLSKGFQKIKCITEDHITPFNTIQNFLSCSFKKICD